MNQLYTRHAVTNGSQDDPFKIGRLTAHLKSLNTNIPADLIAGLPNGLTSHRAFNELEAAFPSRDYVAEAAEAVAKGKDPDVILALMAGNMLRVKVAALIASRVDGAYVASLNDNADLIINTLASEVFEPIIEQLRDLLDEHGEGWDLAAALKAEDFTRAAVIQGAEDIAGQMIALHTTRQLLHPGAFNDTAAWALEHEAFDHIGAPENQDSSQVPNMHKLQWWMDLLAAGYTPHFPTLSEWDTVRRDHAEITGQAEAANQGEPLGNGFTFTSNKPKW